MTNLNAAVAGLESNVGLRVNAAESEGSQVGFPLAGGFGEPDMLFSRLQHRRPLHKRLSTGQVCLEIVLHALCAVRIAPEVVPFSTGGFAELNFYDQAC